jgi:hypothetical protein
MYFWRMASVDSDGHYGSWISSSFLVSNLESTHLGDDRYEFRLKHGNGSNDNQYPSCMDTYIDSGSSNDNFDGDSEMTIDYNGMGGEITGLLGCNLVSNLLPDGYAVESAHLTMTLTSTTSGSPTVGVWENRQNNWAAEDATWSSYDGSNSWANAGAKGSERGSLLDSVSVGSSFIEGDTVEWNVTLAVQNAMREDRRVDFIAAILGVGSGGWRTAYFSTAEGAMADRPELRFVYVPGSDAVPTDPAPSTPLNGSWALGSGVDLTPVVRPTLGWSFSGTMSIGGYLVQMDTQSDFTSLMSETYTSWNDAGFDTTNLTFTPSTDLDTGETWYWRVRAISSTNQIGNWSSPYHFHLPDLTTVVYNSTKASVQIEHHVALPHLNTPHLTDTYVMEDGSGADDTHENATSLLVGETSSGYQAAALIRIPLAEIPQPSGARVTAAELTMFAEYNSVEGEPVAVRPVLRNWSTSANASTYDGINNWSSLGGRGIGTDIGGYVDLVASVSDDWMDFDVTEAVQGALANGQTHLSLMLYSARSTTDLISFVSTEGSASERPYLTLTWEDGVVATPLVSGVNVGPSNGARVWDTASHALQADLTPTFTWTYSGTTLPTAWRVFMQVDANNDMAGLYVYDSRVNTSSFDVANLSFTPSADLMFAQAIRWMVQPINNGMLGPRSTSSVFYLPSDRGGEVNATDAYLSVQEGAFVPALSYPSATTDTYLDSGDIYTNRGTDSSLYVGRSRVSLTNPSLRTSSLIAIDLSSLPSLGTYEVVNATLDLNVITASQSVYMSASAMVTSWSESSVWAYPAGNTSSWLGTGAYLSQDALPPFNEAQWVNSSGTVSVNVTAFLQHALASGQSGINIILQAEEVGGSVDGRLQIASSESSDISVRPRLNMTYRMTNPWLVTAATGLSPADASTLWDLTKPRPSGQNTSYFSWTPSLSNETQWVACSADNERFTINVNCLTSGEMAAGQDPDYLFNPSNTTMTVSNMSKGDYWTYWRVRADQGYRIGEWSVDHSFRNPADQGSDDGFGNHSVDLSRGSVFSTTGLLPSVPDVEIDSNSTVNKGSATTMVLGTNGLGTGESRLLMEFDLIDLPWPTAMTPM